jgi:hypothetical protein
LNSSRITSLIYIDFDELEQTLVYSGTTEQALRRLDYSLTSC